ncbi:MAG: hypothetical protein FWD92_06395 [Methanomassiliicoccaceae archaeon]|nr:hypothetical protein [Methanomassiliicoccaceae archaeon]
MDLSKKGEGGFMESMVAVMIVVISLTAFLSFLSFSTSVQVEKEADIPLDLLDNVCIINGQIEADVEQRMIEITERYGYKGMYLRLSTAGAMYDSELIISVGTCDHGIIRSKGGTIIAGSDGGRSVPVNYSMAVWI